MADLFGVVQTAELAANVGAWKTLAQLIAPANHRVKILGYGVYFDGTLSTNAPVQVELLRQTTAGTGTANTPRQLRPAAETILCTANDNHSAEPTASDVLDVAEVHPQTGYEVRFPPGQEPVVAGGARVGLRVNADNAVNVRGKIIFEE